MCVSIQRIDTLFCLFPIPQTSQRGNVMDLVKFITFLAEVILKQPEMDHEVEMRWLNKYDGDTKWHTLFNEPSMARYGFFPFQAEYRLKLNKRR